MIDHSKPWPLGLRRDNALWYALGFVVLIAALHLVDRSATLWGASLPAEVRRVFRWITRWGESHWILYPTLAGGLIAWLLSLVTRERLQRALGELAALCGFVFLGVGFPGLVSALLKRIIGRGRPETLEVDGALTFHWLSWWDYDYQSFPSGHATTSFALAAVVTLLWPRAFWPAMLFAALIALSRIVTGQHYPTDITAGAVLGLLGAFAVRWLFASRGWLFAQNPDGGITRRPLAAIPALFRR